MYEKEVGKTIVERLQPHLNKQKKPYIANYNMSMNAGGNILFVYPENPKEAPAVKALVDNVIFADLPDTKGFSMFASLLDIGVSMSRSVYLNFNGKLDDASRLVIEQAMERIRHTIPNANVRVLPTLYDKM